MGQQPSTIVWRFVAPCARVRRDSFRWKLFGATVLPGLGFVLFIFVLGIDQITTQQRHNDTTHRPHSQACGHISPDGHGEGVPQSSLFPTFSADKSQNHPQPTVPPQSSPQSHSLPLPETSHNLRHSSPRLVLKKGNHDGAVHCHCCFPRRERGREGQTPTPGVSVCRCVLCWVLGRAEVWEVRRGVMGCWERGREQERKGGKRGGKGRKTNHWSLGCARNEIGKQIASHLSWSLLNNKGEGVVRMTRGGVEEVGKRGRGEKGRRGRGGRGCEGGSGRTITPVSTSWACDNTTS